MKEDKGGIYGVVTDFLTAEPMRAAGVSLHKDGNLLLKTVTYDDGHFEFNDLEVGIYELTVEMNGYESISETVFVESGRIARADIQMTVALTELKVTTLSPELAWVYNAFTQFYWKLYGQVMYPRKKSDMYPIDYGFVYGTSVNPTIENREKIIQFTEAQEDETTCIINFENTSGLDTIDDPTSGVDYHVRAFAVNSHGVYYGADMVCHHR